MVHFVMPKKLRLAALVVAALSSVLIPCLPAARATRAACPMAGCGDSTGASFDAVRECCCEGSALPAASGATTSLRAPMPASSSPTIPSSPAVDSLPSAARAGESLSADRVPLYLLHASLLI